VLTAGSLIEPDAVHEYVLHIDLKPALTAQQLDLRIQRDFASAPNKSAANALHGLLPASMLPVMLRRAGLPGEQKVNAVTRTQRSTLVQCLKDYTLTPTSMRPVTEAIVSRGGVSLREINPNTMACKRITGLFIAGELLDADAFTGGFNLQIAFATGYAAGLNL
jgi:predicted Rossmann fold flavoprotein